MPSQIVLTPEPAVLPARPVAGTISHGPLLIATDGTATSRAALIVGRSLAKAGDSVHILSVVEPTPVMMPVPEAPIYFPELDLERAEKLRERLAEEARAIFGEPLPAVEVEIGSPVETLARRARELRAGMVITGFRHHGRLERVMLRRETPLGIARRARSPVLVVPEGTLRLPRTALIAVDIDEASVNAARRARPLLASAEKVYMVHVRPGDTRLEGETAQRWTAFRERLAQAAFGRVSGALDLPSTVEVETHTLTGHPVEELLDFAEMHQVELIVAGFRRRRIVDRIGRPRKVAERVFRSVACSMLLVPEPSGTELPFAIEAETEMLADKAAWSRELAAFTTRNVGREAHVEIDALPIGSQAQVSGLPLLAIEFDAAASTLRMMFGRAATGASHLTHAIPQPTSLEIQRRRGGEDLALRVGHEEGYTLLTFG